MKITGYHVLGGFVLGFGLIIGVNVLLAVQAVRTFPGLEVQNSYVASQSFDADRAAQRALGWEVSAEVIGGELRLSILADGTPVEPVIEEATFGRATTTRNDQAPDFTFDGQVFRAPVLAEKGNWNLRLKARAGDGTLFQQRIIVKVHG